MTDQNQPIDYGDRPSIKVGYDAGDDYEVTHVGTERVKGLPRSNELPKLAQYVAHMAENGYEPAHALPDVTQNIKNAQLGSTSDRYVFFRRTQDAKATPAEIAAALATRGSTPAATPAPAAPARPAQAQPPATQKPALTNMARLVRNAF